MSRRADVVTAAVKSLQSNGIDALGTTVDVRDYNRCASAANEVATHFGRIDILNNNAAGNFMVPTENLSPGGFSTVVGIDLQGVFHMSKASLPQKTGSVEGAVIINITAFLQDLATPFQTHAAAAKAGIDVLTNQMGVEWAEYGIRVIGLAPGGIAGTAFCNSLVFFYKPLKHLIYERHLIHYLHLSPVYVSVLLNIQPDSFYLYS